MQFRPTFHIKCVYMNIGILPIDGLKTKKISAYAQIWEYGFRLIANLCPISIKFYIRVEETSCDQ